jgi:N,N-dimethylformamidase
MSGKDGKARPFSALDNRLSGALTWNNFDKNISRLTLSVLLRFMDPTPFPMPAA